MANIINFFKKIGVAVKNAFIRHKRKVIQLYAALLYNSNIYGFVTGKIYKGDSKNACVPGLNCYSCPGAVGACPLGALQNAIATSGRTYPFYVLGIIILFGLALGRTICGFLCPVGLMQELLYKIKTPKVKKSKATYVLSYFKYVILALIIAVPLIYQGIPFFCKYICPAGTFEGGVFLLLHPDNDAYFGLLGYLFSWKFIVLVAIVLASIFIFRFMCRFLCPLGAIYGFFSKLALIGIKLDKNACIDCGKCITACKMDIRKVGDHECISCGECISVCPTKAISWKGSKFFLHPSQTMVVESVESQVKIADLVQSLPESENKIENKNNEDKIVVTQKVYDSKVRLHKIIKISIGVISALVLAFSLVYYNFIVPSLDKKEPPQSGNGIEYGTTVGANMKDFTLDLFNTNGQTFTLSENLDKVTVLNFWYTDCDPCVAEIPHFNEVAIEYESEVNVVAVHRYDGERNRAGIEQNINSEIANRKESWSNYKIKFAYDSKTKADRLADMFEIQAYPVTVIINKQGEITCVNLGVMSKAELVAQVQYAINN